MSEFQRQRSNNNYNLNCFSFSFDEYMRSSVSKNVSCSSQCLSHAAQRKSDVKVLHPHPFNSENKNKNIKHNFSLLFYHLIIIK